MRDSSPRAPFDQGLFLTHLNKGKEMFDQRRMDEAERELEEAYMLRPRDPNVLNLLGLVYFKQEKLEKAEEVYRKLTAESPDAHTLYYNLGLIYFKLNRLEEAESAFLRALELARDNPKVNFYLGSIYERMKRPQDAIYQYRQAGANLMVRRVEDKLAASDAGAGDTSQTAPISVVGPPPAAPETEPLRPKGADDTAEFRADAVEEGLRQRADARPRKRSPSDTAPVIQVPPSLTPFPEQPETLPPIRPEPFRLLGNNLMEIEFSGKVFIKQGTIYSYSGNLTFWVKEKRPGALSALVIVTGSGKLILTDKDRDITLLRLDGDVVHVEPTHLLACEEALNPRYVRIGNASKGLDFLAIDGRGAAALSVASRPLPLAVSPDLPVSAPASSIISWTGALTPSMVDDRQVQEVMLAPSLSAERGAVIRLEGTGRLLMEQSV
jgi:tetratricopeptide (TPR) repeat protein